MPQDVHALLDPRDALSATDGFDDPVYPGPMSTDELLAEALRLTRVDRARVAEELLSTPRTEILKELERRRASRTAF